MEERLRQTRVLSLRSIKCGNRPLTLPSPVCQEALMLTPSRHNARALIPFIPRPLPGHSLGSGIPRASGPLLLCSARKASLRRPRMGATTPCGAHQSLLPQRTRPLATQRRWCPRFLRVRTLRSTTQPAAGSRTRGSVSSRPPHCSCVIAATHRRCGWWHPVDRFSRTLHNLKGESVKMFLFGDAYTEHWKARGTALEGILPLCVPSHNAHPAATLPRQLPCRRCR